MTSVYSMELLEDRIGKLERLVGNFEILDQTKGLSTVSDISNKLQNYVTDNSKLAGAMKSLNEIKRYANFDILNEMDDENLIKAKIELILGEEEYLRKINKDFENLQNLTKILDNPALNDIPNLTNKLKQISGKQAEIKESEESFSNEMKEFLNVYFNSIKTISDTMTELNDYLDQYSGKEKLNENEN